MSGETPTTGFIDFTAPRDGKPTRHAIDIVFDSEFETIEARMFWYNPAVNAWVRAFPINTREICVPQAVVKKGGPEAMCQFLVDFFNRVLAELFPATAAPAGESPFPPVQDPDGLVNATRNLLLAYRVERVDGQLRLVK